jgi:hypothetical protein
MPRHGSDSASALYSNKENALVAAARPMRWPVTPAAVVVDTPVVAAVDINDKFTGWA